MEQEHTWYFVIMGDGLWAPTVSAQIEKEFTAAFTAAGSPKDMAVFSRSEEGQMHCNWVAYFSPATQSIARMFNAEPCAKPARGGLGLLAGDRQCWAILFPETQE
jgi:hypothetical protein